MKIVRWAAVVVTALFALMNLGAVGSSDAEVWVRVVGGVLAVLGIAAAVGLALKLSWGRPAVIAVGALNVAASIAALVTDQPGGLVGLVVGGLAVVLGALSAQRESDRVLA